MKFKKPKLDPRTKAGRTKKKKVEDNPCKELKSGTKEKLQCMYKNKQLSNKQFIKRVRKLTGNKKERVNTRTYQMQSKDE
tara:strand:- start:148 stop:387 length:240 start_codon:yes stop_codon:yes gene_type:complete